MRIAFVRCRCGAARAGIVEQPAADAAAANCSAVAAVADVTAIRQFTD